MSKWQTTSFLVLVALLNGCATTQQPYDDNLCQHLDDFAKKIPPGQTETIRLGVEGLWMVNHSKYCAFSEKAQGGMELCSWLQENTSTEFMEANINSALSCLQGQAIVGYIGNTGVQRWSGEINFYSTSLEADVEVTLKYMLDYSSSKSGDERYIEFEFTAD